MVQHYLELTHTADWAVRVWGESLNALFEHAAEAMFELQGANLVLEPIIEGKVSCHAPDLEALLIAWLSELLYLSETQDVLYTRFSVDIQQTSFSNHASDAGSYPSTPEEPGYILRAAVQGLRGRGHLAHIKAATYYDLRVVQTAHGWEAVVTFDT